MRGGHGLFGTIGDYFRFAQMLANGGALEATRVIGRKTLALMHANRLPPALLPLEIGGLPLPGYGFGLGSRVCHGRRANLGARDRSANSAGRARPRPITGSIRRKQMVGIFMTQSMLSFDLPELDLRALAYQAIED